MAMNLLPLNSVSVRAGPPRSESNRRRAASNNWWSPVFGWSADPDYIGSDSKPEDKSAVDLESKPARSRFVPGGFTEEKAKQLRMMTNETASFHDAMYHSAIASRLASDFKRPSDR